MITQWKALNARKAKKYLLLSIELVACVACSDKFLKLHCA